MHQQQCALILLFAFNQIVQTVLQGIPTSPCPKMFQYRFDGMEWFGMLSVKDPDRGQPLHLRVTLSLRGKPTTDYLGEIELITRGQYFSDAPVLYKIKFPKTNFPPKLLQITINDHVVCLGSAEQSIFVTQIQLEHTRKFTFIPDDTSMPLTPDIALHTALAPPPVHHRPDGLDSLHEADDLLPTNFALESKQLKNLPLTRFDSSMRATKDICGTIDNRIRFQILHATKQSSSSNGSSFRKSVVNKFRSSAGDISSQKAPNANLADTDYHNDGDENDDINNSGASIPLVTADFLDPLTDDVDSTTMATISKGLPSITRGAWPWLAAIYVNNLTSLAYQCGGTLISARIIISSAHCFKMFQKSFTANEVLVFLGRHNLKNWSEEGSLAAPVDDIFTHPDFDQHLNTYDADIAVLVLKNSVRFNAFIRPACLWSGATNTEFIEGEHGIVVGWGLSSSNPTAATSSQAPVTYDNVVPRAIDAPIVSNDVCFKANDKFHSLSSNRTFCAGVVASSSTTPSKLTKFKAKMMSRSKQKSRVLPSGPCTGDSGAGLMIFKNNRWLLRGMVSASVPTNEDDNNRQRNVSPAAAAGAAAATKTDSIELGCNVNQYVIYTDVAKFLDWIFAFII